MKLPEFLKREKKGEAPLSLFCPKRSEKIPIGEHPYDLEFQDKRMGVVGYNCHECGGVHCWHFGPPAPIYVGDDISFRFEGESG